MEAFEPIPPSRVVVWFIDDVADAIKPDSYQPPVDALSVLRERVLCLLELEDGAVLVGVGPDRREAHRAAMELYGQMRAADGDPLPVCGERHLLRKDGSPSGVVLVDGAIAKDQPQPGQEHA